MPEHADLIRSIPDERLVAMDKEHARRRCEKIQTNRAILMQASSSVSGSLKKAKPGGSVDKKSTDYTLEWMYHNLPPEQITLDSYIALNWCGDKTLEDLEAEELASLPEELYPEPVSKVVM